MHSPSNYKYMGLYKSIARHNYSVLLSLEQAVFLCEFVIYKLELLEFLLRIWVQSFLGFNHRQ